MLFGVERHVAFVTERRGRTEARLSPEPKTTLFSAVVLAGARTCASVGAAVPG